MQTKGLRSEQSDQNMEVPLYLSIVVAQEYKRERASIMGKEKRDQVRKVTKFSNTEGI